MKIKHRLDLILATIIVTFIGFSLSANADKTLVLKASNRQLYMWTHDCLREASNSDSPKYQTKVLTWAVEHLKEVSIRMGSNPQLNQAITDVKAALDDVRNQGNSDTLKQDIDQSLEDVRSLESK